MPLHETDPTRRFSDRVGDYVRYRPGYPDELISWLFARTGLDRTAVVADVGSGTGFLTQMFLDAGCRVFAVEPNDAMRAAAEGKLGGHGRFESVAGRAESTTLPDASVDLVVAAQAFHWFDAATAKNEFRRILRPPGRVAIIWNTRDIDATPFMRAYEQLLVERAVDYTGVDHRNALAGVADFLGPHSLGEWKQTNTLTGDEALGRMMSASYVPGADHPGHDRIVAGLREIVAEHARDGCVDFVYTTGVHLGTIAGD